MQRLADRNARSTVPLRIGTSSRSPSRYSRFAMPCFFASSDAELDHLLRVVDRDHLLRAAAPSIARSSPPPPRGPRSPAAASTSTAPPRSPSTTVPARTAVRTFPPARRSSAACGRAACASPDAAPPGRIRSPGPPPPPAAAVPSAPPARSGDRRRSFPPAGPPPVPPALSCARCVEIWLCPLDRISCNSATDSSSFSSSSRMRRRFGSAASRRDLRIDAMSGKSLISIYQDLLMRG